MIITKTDEYVLLKNDKGEYHLTHDKFNELGEVKAIEFAEIEIQKKLETGQYPFETINFNQARDLGFCEYGINEFCEALNLDKSKDYAITDLNRALTLEILKQYPGECIKLFGSDTLKYLGGVKGVLSEDTVSLVLRPEFIPEKTLHILSTKFAYQCLPNYEKEYPDDNRVRAAIEAKESWIIGDITDDQLRFARSAAESAAWTAAESATRSARSAAWSAARSAAESAAESAARKEQIDIILAEL